MRRESLIWLAIALAPAPALGQAPADPDVVQANVEQMIAAQRQAYGIDRPVIRCRQDNPDEIVVCVDHGRDQAMPSTAESDPNSRAARKALDGNIPSAPFVGSISCRRGADGVCRGNMGGAPAPAYYLDVSALPQAPEGSDADKIAKGEAPAP